MPLAAGDILGRYRIVAVLGIGGMATVYRARHPRLNVDVALKVIAPALAQQPQFQARFQREAEALYRLNHPAILRLMDLDEADGQSFIVYPFIAGGTLRDRHAGTPWSVATVLRLLAPIADALDYAHGLGMVHRDVKPANILLQPDETPMLADFGLVRLLSDAAGDATISVLTSEGMALGTPIYMAPEQVLAWDITGQTDQYALGVVAYELLAGRPPYRPEGPRDTPQAIAYKHVSEPLPPLRQFQPAVSSALEGALATALAKEPAERYPSCRAFLAALAHAASATPTEKVARPPAPPDRATEIGVGSSPAAAGAEPLPERADDPHPADAPTPPSPPPTTVVHIPPARTAPLAADQRPAAPVVGGRRRLALGLAAVGCVLSAVAVFLPWVTVTIFGEPSQSQSALSVGNFPAYQLGSWLGTFGDADGSVVLALALAGLVLTVLLLRGRPRARWLRPASVGVAGCLLVLALLEVNYVHTVSRADPLRHVGVGLWLLVLGGALALAGAIWQLRAPTLGPLVS
jgi:serine/threonine protein kinase